MRVHRLAAFLVSSLLLAAALRASAAETYKPDPVIVKAKPLYRETTLVRNGVAQAAIIIPDGAEYTAVGARVAAALRTAAGVEVAVKPDVAVAPSDRSRHMICLGQMGNNRVVFDLYARQLAACDDWFPGPQGHVVRTICDPWGLGTNVILLGGSDRDGVERAVAHFERLLTKGPTLTLPRLVEVVLPGRELLDSWAPAAVAEFRKQFVQAPSLAYLAEQQWIRMAELYFLTGRDEFAQAWAEGVARWMQHYYAYTPERQITQPKYMIPRLILDFDMMEEHPALPEAIRLEYTNLLYDYVSRMAVHSRITQLRPGVLADTGLHQVSLTVTFGGRYFKTYYPDAPMERIERGLASVRVGFDTVKQSGGWFDENGGYTRFYPQTTMLNSIALNDLHYFTSGNAARWLRQQLILTSNLPHCILGTDGLDRTFGPPSLALGEWHYRNGQWRWLFEQLHHRTDWHPRITDKDLTAFPWLWLPNVPAVQPEDDLIGVRWQPVDAPTYAELRRLGKKVNVPRERTFHALALRARYDRNAPYLLLDGIDDGIAKGGDGNAVECFTAAGRSWLISGKWGSSSSKYHSTVLILRNGQLPTKATALCDLECAADLPSCGLVRSVMRDVNGSDWARNILWKNDGCFVVLDTVRATEAGDFSVFCQWRTRAGVLNDTVFRETVADARFEIIAADGAQLQEVCDEDVQVFRQAQHGLLRPGDSRTFINLIRTVKEPAAAGTEIRLRRLAQNVVAVTDGGAPAVLGAAVDASDPQVRITERLVIRAKLFLLTPERLCAAGFGGLYAQALNGTLTPLIPKAATEDVELDLAPLRQTAAVDAALRDLFEFALAPAEPLAAAPASAQLRAPLLEWRHPKKAAITALAALPDGHLAVGAQDGSVTVLRPDGTTVWTFSAGKRVNALAAADVLGDGRPAVLVASDDFRVYCLDHAGKERWRFSTEGHALTRQTAGEYGPGLTVTSEGEAVSVLPAVLDATGRPDVLVGTRTFMHGSRRVFGTTWRLAGDTGAPRWHLYQSGGCVISMDVADVTGDGVPEIAVGTGGGTYGRSAYLLSPAGDALNRFTGAYGEKYVRLARLRPNRPVRLVRMEARDGRLEVFACDAPYGSIGSQPCGGLTAVGPAVSDLDGDGVAEIIVASSGGSVYAWNETEKGIVQSAWRVNLMESLSAMAVADVFGVGRPGLVVGSQQGGIHALDGTGRTRASARAGAPVTVLAAWPGSARVAAGTSLGHVALVALE